MDDHLGGKNNIHLLITPLIHPLGIYLAQVDDLGNLEFLFSVNGVHEGFLKNHWTEDVRDIECKHIKVIKEGTFW